MQEIYLSLGSNIGDRQRFIDKAVDLLSTKIKILQRSNLYQTAPWGKTDQAQFLNLCISGKTSLKPEELLSFIKQVEAQSGRKPAIKWGPREIDIDILFYENQVINLPNLLIPHPNLQERAFVLVPLNEIAPELIHPQLNKTIGKLTKNIGQKGVDLYET